MCFHFFYTVQADTIYQKVLYDSCLFLFLRHGIQKTKELILHKWGFIVFYSKNNFCVMNKIKLVFWVKNLIFSCILKIFFTMWHLKIILEYWIILYIFRILLCVTSPLLWSTNKVQRFLLYRKQKVRVIFWNNKQIYSFFWKVIQLNINSWLFQTENSNMDNCLTAFV